MSNLVKILVIEDEFVGRQLLEAMLTPENYDVIFGENGEQGLELAISELPDIILCDVMMPGVDGFEVCQRIRANENTNHLPIFLITALDDRDSRIRGIVAGADDYISKPFDRVEILAKIKNCLNRLKSRKQVTAAVKESPHGNSIFNRDLLEELIGSISGNVEKDNNIELFQSSRKMESKHLFSRRHYHEKFYYFLISNTLDSVDAVILNCTLMCLFHQYSAENNNTASEIINKFISQKDEIITSMDLNDESKVKISIVAIMHNPEEDTITCSGINQVLLINSGRTGSDSTAKHNYQPYHVSGIQDIYLKQPDQILLLSPNISNQVDQQELSAYINEEIEKNGEESLTGKIPVKFNLTQDVLVVKLNF